MIFHDVRTRVMHTLTSLADKYGVSVDGGKKIPIRLSHREIANLVGASRETVTLELNNLRRSGHIGVEGRRIIVFS